MKEWFGGGAKWLEEIQYIGLSSISFWDHGGDGGEVS